MDCKVYNMDSTVYKMDYCIAYKMDYTTEYTR